MAQPNYFCMQMYVIVHLQIVFADSNKQNIDYLQPKTIPTEK